MKKIILLLIIFVGCFVSTSCIGLLALCDSNLTDAEKYEIFMESTKNFSEGCKNAQVQGEISEFTPINP